MRGWCSGAGAHEATIVPRAEVALGGRDSPGPWRGAGGSMGEGLGEDTLIPHPELTLTVMQTQQNPKETLQIKY